MQKRSSTKRPHDPNQLAAAITAKATEDPSTQEQEPQAPEMAQDIQGKNPAAVALGRLGGKKGGLARARKLTSQERIAIARKAARSRWDRGLKT
jgi:hypothetical protein